MNTCDMDVIVRGSTEVLSFEAPEGAENLSDLWVIFSKVGTELLTLDLADFTVENGVYSHTLSQEETLSLVPGVCEIQIKFLFADGSAPVTYPKTHILVDDTAKDEVIGGE